MAPSNRLLVLPAAALLLCHTGAAAVPRDAWSAFVRNARDPHLASRAPVPVDYRGRHPFEERALQERRSQSTSAYQPIRVHFDTHLLDALVSSHPSQVSYVRETLLPPLKSFWSDALSVVPASTIEVPLNGLCAQQAQALSGFGLGDFVANTTENVTLSSAGNSLVFDETDLVMIVLPMEETPICPAGVTAETTIATLAFALNCQNDQMDRPTVGYTGICFGPLVLAEEGTKIFERQFLTVAHELGHVLGMNSYDMAFFRDPNTGEPRTPRNMFNRPPIKQVLCVDGVRRAALVPSENTMKPVETSNGYIAYEVVTETVRNVVRNQFDCQSMEGARLENQPTAQDDCFGSHFDHRLFNNHLMVAAYTGSKLYVTALNLALLEDSGWYKANYSIAENSPYGLGAGCKFVEELCVTNGTVPEWAEGTFCSNPQNIGCTPDHRVVAFCGVRQFAGNLASGYQYFQNPSLGGVMPQRDFCPAFTSLVNLDVDGKVKALDCTDASLADTAVPFKGEAFGEESRCVLSPMANLRPVCLEVICIEDGEDAGKVALVAEGERTLCSTTGEVMRLSNGIDITCPKFEQICPQSLCPANCAGRGICDYSLSPARCQCFDAGDTSPYCAESPLSLEPTDSPAPTQIPAMPSAAPTMLAQSTTPTGSPSALSATDTGSPTAALATEWPTESSVAPSLIPSLTTTKAPGISSMGVPTAKPTLQNEGPVPGAAVSASGMQSSMTPLLVMASGAFWLFGELFLMPFLLLYIPT